MQQNDWIKHLQSSQVCDKLQLNRNDLFVQLLPMNALCADETLKFTLFDKAKKPIAFALCSSKVSPFLISRAVENSQEAYAQLEEKTKKHILLPLLSGTLEDISYAVYPYCQKTSDSRLYWRIQREILAKPLFEWLFEVAQQTKQSAQQRKQEFLLSLEYIEEQEAFSQKLRKKADRGKERIEKGIWKPFFTLMHADMWKENIMFYKGAWREWVFLKNFIVIDWAGASLQGYPIYDFVRLAENFGISKTSFLKGCKQYTNILDCDKEDLSYYLLAALGHIGRNLEHFPYDRWCELTKKSYQRIEDVIGAS